MQDLPAKLREAIDQRDDREGFRGYAVELADMPEDVPDGWLYIAVYSGGAKAGCTYIDRRYYSERTIEGMEVEIGPAWLNVDNAEDAVRSFLGILRDGRAELGRRGSQRDHASFPLSDQHGSRWSPHLHG